MEFDQSLDSTPAEVLKEIKEKVDDLYSIKSELDALEKKYKTAKNELTTILEEAGVDKVQGDTCTVSLQQKTSVSVPKDPATKKRLFNYIENNHGKDALANMLTINARTFSSWHDKEVEAHVAQGNTEWKLDMVEPYTYYTIGMRKRAVKK